MKREELIAYDEWLTGRKWGAGEIISPEMAADLYLAEHPLPPAEGARRVQWSGYGELGNISQKPLQPPAEGAEEILDNLDLGEPLQSGEFYYRSEVVKAMQEFATLHAQRLAEKIVEEKAVGFADWLSKLQPSQKVSVWSKNGEHRGLFTMDNEQLYKKYLKSIEP